MKYVVIGAGGTGGGIGVLMAKAGKDVTLIARGAHLEAIKERGLVIEKLWENQMETVQVDACAMEEYQGQADVIFVCVKYYSLDSTVPFIRRISGKNTVVIPILNIYGTGGKLQEVLPDILVTDGCIYISAEIKAPGHILMHSNICRIVYGLRNHEVPDILKQIHKDLTDCKIKAVISENIQRDALRKFSYVAPIGACGLYLNATAGEFQKEGRPREMFKAMVTELMALAGAMGIEIEEDWVSINLNILDTLLPETTTSMQRDVMAGKVSEMDGLVFEVIRMAEKYHVDMPVYTMVAEKFGYGKTAQ